MSPREISIHYRRLPDHERIFHQSLVATGPEYHVTFLEAAPVERPVTAGGATILEPGSPVVWFTYPGRWYDIGRFHRADGTFTGYYANILTPVEMDGRRWSTTDLCLDVWMDADGSVHVLDEDEFDHAVREGWMDYATAERARATAASLGASASVGAWPPRDVREWTLERARAVLREG